MPLPTPQEILRDDTEATPPWLDVCSADTSLNADIFEAMLKSRVVFYPGAGINDGETFEVFTRSHAAHCVIHVDLHHDPRLVSRIVNGEIPGRHARIAGYRPIAQQVLAPDVFQALAGLESEHPFGQAPALGGAYWAVLEREAGLTDDHGPARIVFLHVQCEAVWLFWNLWCRRRTDGPFAMLVQDHGFGGNWSTFGAGGSLHQLAITSETLPKWILFGLRYGGTIPWPGYQTRSDPTPWVERRTPLELGDTEYRGSCRVLFTRLPDDHPRVVAARLRNTNFAEYLRYCHEHGLQLDVVAFELSNADFDAYLLHCLKHDLQPDYL